MEYLRHNLRCKIIRGKVFRYSDVAKEFVLSTMDAKNLVGFQSPEAEGLIPEIPTIEDIKKAMTEKGMSTFTLSRKMGRDEAWADRFFNGKQRIHRRSYQGVALLLDMTEYV